MKTLSGGTCLVHNFRWSEQLHTSFVLPWGAQGTIENLVEIFTEHEETHAQEIREIIARGK